MSKSILQELDEWKKSIPLKEFYHLKQLCLFENVLPCQLTAKCIHHFFQANILPKLAAGKLKPTSAINIFYSLQRFVASQEEAGVFPSGTTKHFFPPSLRSLLTNQTNWRRSVTIFPEHFLTTILKESKTTFLFPVFLLTIRCGLRTQEIISLQKSDLFFLHNTWHLTIPKEEKTDKKRGILLPEEVGDQLFSFISNYLILEDQPLCISPRGKKYTSRTLQRHVKNFMEERQKELIFPYVATLQELRQSFLGTLNLQGVDIQQSADYLNVSAFHAKRMSYATIHFCPVPK